MSKVLLIEDDEFILSLYAEKFTRTGFEVEIAKDGAKGLAALKEYSPDVILLDITMPNVDGFEVLEKIKENKKMAGVAVVILTNLSDDPTINKAMGLGADSYIVKSSSTPTEVVAKVENILEISARGRASQRVERI